MRDLFRIVVPMTLLLAATFVAGCGGGSESGATTSDSNSDAKPVIGVSLLTLANPFFVAMKDAMIEAGNENGYEVRVVSGELDPARQNNQVDDFITSGVDAIILCPVDSKAIGTSIKNANDAGIPVFTADIAVLAEGLSVVSHVATDNFAGGRMAADAMGDALPSGGQIAIIDHPEVESVILRTGGFEERLAEINADRDQPIEVVAKLPGRGAQDESFKAMEAILQSHPQVRGVFAINDPSALGVVAALEKADRLSEVTVIGFDGAPEAISAVRAGKISADIVQHPDQIGRRAVESVAAYSLGEAVAPEQLIAPTLLTPANIDDAS